MDGGKRGQRRGQSGAELGDVIDGQALQRDRFYGDGDRGVHGRPPSSTSVSGFSSLVYSRRVAASRCSWVTTPPFSAARNAAPSAIVRMLPPAICNRARRSTSTPSVGRVGG